MKRSIILAMDAYNDAALPAIPEDIAAKLTMTESDPDDDVGGSDEETGHVKYVGIIEKTDVKRLVAELGLERSDDSIAIGAAGAAHASVARVYSLSDGPIDVSLFVSRPIRHWDFTITIHGSGENLEEAWDFACEGLAQLKIPAEDMFRVETDEEGNILSRGDHSPGKNENSLP